MPHVRVPAGKREPGCSGNQAVGLAVSGTSVDTYVRTAAGGALLSSLGGGWKAIDVRAPALPG